MFTLVLLFCSERFHFTFFPIGILRFFFFCSLGFMKRISMLFVIVQCCVKFFFASPKELVIIYIPLSVSIKSVCARAIFFTINATHEMEMGRLFCMFFFLFFFGLFDFWPCRTSNKPTMIKTTFIVFTYCTFDITFNLQFPNTRTANTSHVYAFFLKSYIFYRI